MDDIGQKITEILQDPGRMQQIMEMASALGLPTQSETEDPVLPSNNAALQQVSNMIRQAETKEKRQQTLMQALLPYLSPGRQARLEQAMRISHLSRIAGAALRGNLWQETDPKEAD